MNLDFSVLLIILGCALVTFIPRVVPFAIIRNVKLPAVLTKWLTYIPVCLLTALIVQGTIHQTESLPAVNWSNVVVIIPTLLVAIKTRSLFKTVIVGMITAAVIRLF